MLERNQAARDSSSISSLLNLDKIEQLCHIALEKCHVALIYHVSDRTEEIKLLKK